MALREYSLVERTTSHCSITDHRQGSIQIGTLVPAEWMRIDFFS